jgi:hypothetical protein
MSLLTGFGESGLLGTRRKTRFDVSALRRCGSETYKRQQQLRGSTVGNCWKKSGSEKLKGSPPFL